MTNSKITARVTDEAMASINAITKRTGVKNQAIYDRVFEWFGTQPPGVQALILKQIPEEFEGQVARMVLDSMAHPNVAGKLRPAKAPPGRAARQSDNKE